MRKLYLFLSLSIFISCQSKEEKLRKEIQPIVINYYKELAKEDKLTLDSVKILKIDTLTEKKDSVNSYWRLHHRYTSSIGLFKAQGDLVRSNLNLMRLSSGLSSSLYENAKSDFENEQEKFNEMVRISDIQSKRLDALDKLIQSRKLDSITPKGFIVLSSIKARNAKNEANDYDSLSLVLDLDKRIRVKKEFE